MHCTVLMVADGLASSRPLSRLELRADVTTGLKPFRPCNVKLPIHTPVANHTAVQLHGGFVNYAVPVRSRYRPVPVVDRYMITPFMKRLALDNADATDYSPHRRWLCGALAPFPEVFIYDSCMVSTNHGGRTRSHNRGPTMSASFLSAVAIRSSDASSTEGFNEQRSSLTSLPHALVELLLSYLPYPMLGAVCSTNRLFRRLQECSAGA